MNFLFGLIALFALIGIIYPTPLHRKLKITSRWIALAVLIIALILAHATDPATYRQATSSYSAPSSTPISSTPGPTTSSSDYHLGEHVNVGYLGFQVITVKEISDVKDYWGIHHSPGDNAKYILIKLSIQNNDKDKVTVDGSLLNLIEADGTKYAADQGNSIWVNPPNASFFLQPINPKIRKTANVLFPVPNNLSPSDLKLEVRGGFWSGDTADIDLN